MLEEVKVKLFRKSLPEVFLAKVVLRICSKFTEVSFQKVASVEVWFQKVALKFSEQLLLKTPLEGCFLPFRLFCFLRSALLHLLSFSDVLVGCIWSLLPYSFHHQPQFFLFCWISYFFSRSKNQRLKQPPEVFCKERCSWKFCKLHTKKPCVWVSLAASLQVFSCEICEILKSSYFQEQLGTTVSENRMQTQELVLKFFSNRSAV